MIKAVSLDRVKRLF